MKKKFFFSLGRRLVCNWDSDSASTKLAKDTDFSRQRTSASSLANSSRWPMISSGWTEGSCRTGKSH
jgi:hypothetical protein